MKLEIQNYLQKKFNISFLTKNEQPISNKNVIRVLLALVFVLSLLAGYYQAALSIEQKKYLRLEDAYVRVRSELGREETQRLIDLSREKELSN